MVSGEGRRDDDVGWEAALEEEGRVVVEVVAMQRVFIVGVGRYNLVQAGMSDGGFFVTWLLLPSRDECNLEESPRRPAGRVRRIWARTGLLVTLFPSRCIFFSFPDLSVSKTNCRGDGRWTVCFEGDLLLCQGRTDLKYSSVQCLACKPYIVPQLVLQGAYR
jgi:hypothetical protein